MRFIALSSSVEAEVYMKINRSIEVAFFFFGVVMIAIVIMLCAMSKGHADTLTVNSMYLQKDRVQYRYSHSLESESPEVSGIQRTDMSDLDGLQVWVDTDV